jgi:hypothetical protein
MNSILPDHHYIPNDANPCECSEVVYSFVSACGLCQGRIIINWTNWVAGCSGANGPYKGYPEAIPPNTAFPDWAYIDVSIPNNFSLSAAQALVGPSYPESTPVSQSLLTGTGAASTSSASPILTSVAGGGGGGGGVSTPAFSFSNPTVTGTGSNPSDSGTGSGSSTSNAGAIAGGVVGGLVALGLIAGLIAWLLVRRRRQNQTAPSAEYGTSGAPYASGPSPVNGGAPTNNTASVYGSDHPQMGQYSAPAGSAAALRPYNPSDPSTFPVSPGTPTIQTTQQPGYGHNNYGAPAPAPGQYSGVAEL